MTHPANKTGDVTLIGMRVIRPAIPALFPLPEIPAQSGTVIAVPSDGRVTVQLDDGTIRTMVLATLKAEDPRRAGMVKIGAYRVSRALDGRVWVEGLGGEGGDFAETDVAKVIGDFFEREF